MHRLALLVLLSLLHLAPSVEAATPPATPSEGAAALVNTQRSAKARKGLGLPSYKKLLGKRWKQRVSGLDARFAGQIAGSKVTRDSIEDLLGNDPLKAGDSVKGRGGKQTRQMRVATAVTTGECPQYTEVPDNALKYWFAVKAEARSDYVISTTERNGHYDITTTIVLETKLHASSPTGSDADLGDPTADYGEIALTRKQVAKDRRTGRTRRTGPVERLTSSIGPLFDVEGDFEAFIEAANRGDDAPAPRRQLRSRVWEDTAQRAVAVLYLALKAQWAEVRKHMQTPNYCVEMNFQGPERLAPAQSTQVIGHLAATKAPAPEAAIVEHSRAKSGFLESTDMGQTIAWTIKGDVPFPVGKPWLTFTAPPRVWPETTAMGFNVLMGTPLGLADAGLRFKPAADTAHFRILSATFDTHTSASSEDTYCGTQAGSKNYSGELTDDEFDPNDRITFTGEVEGEVDATVDSRTTAHTLTGCGEHKEPCQTTMPDRTGSASMSFSVAPAPDPANVELTWSLHDPEVGFVDAGDPECNVHIWGAFPFDVQKRTIPLATLQGSDPITLTFQGQGDLETNWDGMVPAQIHHSWNYAFKLQPVDAEGNPLPR